MLTKKYQHLKIYQPIKQLIELVTGSTSPSQTALSLTVGFYISLFPIIGTTTIVALIVSILFRLNHLIIQGMNLLLFPLQILFLYPFFKLGEIMVADQNESIQTASWVEFASVNGWNTGYYIFESAIAAITVWIFFSVSTGIFLYRIIFRFVKNRIK